MINPEWRKFLEQRGFVTNSEGVPIHQDRFSSADTQVMDLSHLGFVDVAGEDATEFLQGQLTNDLYAVTPTQSQLSAYCNPKGRVLAIFYIVRKNGRYRLIAPQEILQSVVQRLRIYVLRAQVSLEIVPELVAIGVSGAQAESMLKMQMGSSPSPGGIAAREALDTIGVGRQRWMIVGSAADIRRLWEGWEKQALSTDSLSWRRKDILDGLPQVFSATKEAFIPQMVNLDLIGGVSFSKGCYPGQEIVARLRYLGKLKQRMLGARVLRDSRVAAGDGIYTPERGTQRVGTVVDAQTSPDGDMVLLATAPLTHLENGSLLLSPGAGEPLERFTLPYDIPNQA